MRFPATSSLLPTLPLVLLAAACGGSAPAPENSSTTPKASPGPLRNGEVIAEYNESIHPGLPPFSFTLTGTKPDADTPSAQVRTIEVRRNGDPDPTQIIDAAAELPSDRPGAFEVLDMNFDGYRDMRLIESLPAGPNIPYRNWTFNQTTSRFEPAPDLDRLTSPVFDPDTKTIRSAWRESAAHYGEDTYAYIAGKSALVRREERLYTAPGVYRLTISERANGELQMIESREIRE